MFKNFGKHTLQTFAVGLIVAPAFLYGQDLGSSNGLFRSPNPSAKPAAEKRTTPAKKVVTKTVAKRETPRPVAKRRAAPAETNEIAQKPVRQPSTINNKPVGENVVIKVGAKKNVENTEAQLENSIEAGNVARDERNYQTAEAAYRRAQTLNPKDSRSIYGLGNLFSDQQRWEEAEKAYRTALQLEPNNPEAIIALSFVLTQPVPSANLMERYAEAEKMARKAIEIDPKNAVAYDQLGVALEYRGVIDNETQNAYRKAVELDPTFALAYAHLGRLLRRKGLNDASSMAYGDAIRMAVDIPTMILVADVMQSQQRYNESEQLLRRALKSDPKNPTALYLLGRAMTTRGEFAEAEKLLKTSVEVSPNSFVSYAQLSSLYVRRNNFAEAEKTLMKALPVVSANEKKRLAQEFEFVGDGFMRSGRKTDAVRVYQQAVELDAEKATLSAKLRDAQKS